MATRHGHQEAFTVDPALKSADIKNQFDHDADTLLVQVKRANEAAKVLRKKQKKIDRKLQQKTSKNLQKCIENYNNSLMDIKEAVNKMQDVLSDGGFHEKELPGNKPYYWSQELHESRKRPMLHMDLFSSPRIECMMCIKKDKDIKEFEARLESFKRKEKEHETQLKEALQAYDKLQEERDFKIRNLQETEMRREKDSKLQSGFEEQDRPYKAKSLLTWEGPRKQKKRSGVPSADAKECMNCYSKAEKIECLEVSLKQTVMDREEFKQKYQDERDQRIKYQHLYKEEQEGKEDALQRLKEVLQAYDKLPEERKTDKTKIRNPQEIEMRREKDSNLQRLSATVSSRLIDNDPNIADLSDHNRPTKIAEKLSELYDNQWEDAYDALQIKQMKEEDIIELLKDLLFRAFRKCESIASEKYFEKVQRFIELPVQGASVPRVSVLPDTLKQQIKDFRKLRAEYVIEDLEKVIKNELKSAHSHLEAVQTYISGCIEISWLMAVQDPPLVLSTAVPLKFDTNLFKHYTRQGKYVEYVVWPALYLHEGGAVLAKGVVQGCDHPSRVQ